MVKKELPKEIGIILIHDFVKKYDIIQDGKDSFPTSQRIINWIKYLTLHEIKDKQINAKIYEDAIRLAKNLEYHLMANHLLENAFALLFASYYFQDKKIYFRTKDLLERELQEQILSDGSHFELSPMYHQHILAKVLDCINLVQNNPWQADELQSTLMDKASAMLSWSKNVTFSDDLMPGVNDSSNNIFVTTKRLLTYANNLKVYPTKAKLSESGYRMIRSTNFELFVDIGNIGPDYQPGHAHADTLNFLLHLKGVPFIVDTGTSTYEIGEVRNYERSTLAHNTVSIADQNSSEVWHGFRVARRARVKDIKESANEISAAHDGYKRMSTRHHRRWSWTENLITISDELCGNVTEGIAYLHFDPNIKVNKRTSDSIMTSLCLIKFHGHEDLQLDSYSYAEDFNIRTEATVVKMPFRDKLTTEIYFNLN